MPELRSDDVWFLDGSQGLKATTFAQCNTTLSSCALVGTLKHLHFNRPMKIHGNVRSTLGARPWPSKLIVVKTRVRGYTDAEADILLAEAASAICVQKFDGSRNSAIHTTYRISLRSSSLREPRYPLLRVVLVNIANCMAIHISVLWYSQ